MKTFNKNEDNMINELAVAFANGDIEAGDKFALVIEPKMTSYSRKKFAGDMSKEDLAGEFLLVAVELAYIYAERYIGKGNFMAFLYKACDNKLIDLGRNSKAEKRSRTFQVGDETHNREISLQTKIGEDGDSTMADKVAFDQKSVEDQVIDKLNENTVELVVKDFVSSTKGRNSKIVPLVYRANKEDWTAEELNEAIAEVLEDEKGIVPNNEAIRQAKSRAMKALRTSLIEGDIRVCNQLEWEF